VTRQRISLRTPALAYVARIFAVVLALILVWYGLMLCLLAAKVSPTTVNSISAYRTVYDHAAKLGATDFTTSVRLIAGFAGLLAFVIFVFLALQELPRPHLTRAELDLTDDEGKGSLQVAPRAVERIAETAAAQQGDVSSASARLGDQELSVAITVRRATTVADTLRSVRQRIRDAMERHDLPVLAVNVTARGYDRKTRRELS